MSNTTLTLIAEPRTLTGKRLKRLRQEGLIPGVVYGRGRPNTLVSVEAGIFEKLYRQAGENTLVNLVIGGGPRTVLIQEVARDPVKQHPIHVDFFEVRLDKTVKTEVPLSFVGSSPAVKELGGTLLKLLHEIEIEALPANIPHEITVDISALKTFDEQIKVKDLAVGAGVKVLADPEEIAAQVLPPRTQEELEELAEAVIEDVSKVEDLVEKETEEEPTPSDGAKE